MNFSTDLIKQSNNNHNDSNYCGKEQLQVRQENVPGMSKEEFKKLVRCLNDVFVFDLSRNSTFVQTKVVSLNKKCVYLNFAN